MEAFLLGLCVAAAYWAFYRVFTIKFPLNFISPVYASIPLFGVPLGLALGWRAPKLSPRSAALLAGGLVLFTISALAYKDKSAHYLLFGAYYDYPQPTSAWVTRGLLASLPLSIVPFVVTFARFAALSAAIGSSPVPALLLGLGGGVLLAELLTPTLGAYTILVSASAACTVFLPGWYIWPIAAGSILAAGALMRHPAEAFFTWQLREYERVETYWTHFYKWDWIKFDGDHCVGGVHNEIMVHYSCDSPEKLPLTHLKMAEAISNGPVRRERVASLGRSDGIIATAHKARNPHLKRFVAVENDAQIAGDIRTRYSRQQGDIFTSDPRIELAGGSERLWLERTKEKFDAVYLDGIGLMLVPYPFTLIQQENYLFSADAYRRIFDDLLTEDGVLIVDRGTTTSGESQDLGAGLPEGIHVRTLFTKIPTYPLTGLPLVYIIASRNADELDRIVGELVKGNLYGQDGYDHHEAQTRRSSDNWPMFQPGAIAAMHAVTAPFLILTVAFVLWQLHRETGSWHRRDAWSRVALGIIAALIGIWVTARAARAFVDGPQVGFAVTFAMLLAGAAASLAALRQRAGVSRLPLALGSCTIAFGVLLLWPFSAWAALLASLAGGAGIGVLAAGETNVPAPAGRGFALTLGMLIGIYVFQIALMIVGFQVLAGCLLLLVALSGMTGRQAPIALGAPAPLRG
jgi:hypothetical protein